jgi:hypothetical protein
MAWGTAVLSDHLLSGFSDGCGFCEIEREGATVDFDYWNSHCGLTWSVRICDGRSLAEELMTVCMKGENRSRFVKRSEMARMS